MKKVYLILGFCIFVAVPVLAQEKWSKLETLEENINNGDYGTVTSLLIMDHGQIVYEGYFNGTNADSLHNTRSVPKTITGMAVGAAVDDGLLSVDMPAAGFFNNITPFENPDPRKNAMTLQDMLTMSGILDCDDDNYFSHGTEARMHSVEDWASYFWDLPIRGYPGWSEKPATAKYGRVFAYCSPGVEMAGQVVERATKTTFQDYVQTKFFDPMGITQFEWQENGLGQAHKSGGLSLTTRGLAKFAEMQRSGGVHNNKRILSQRWTEESVKPRVVAYADQGIEYGYLWWRSSYEVSGQQYENYYMSGNGGNRVLVMPEHGVVVVVTKTDFNQRGAHQKTEALIEKEVVLRLSQ